MLSSCRNRSALCGDEFEFARRMDPAAVVVAGGDGTVACAAEVLAGSSNPGNSTFRDDEPARQRPRYPHGLT